MTLPALDPYLDSIGEPLEDLGRVGPSQPFQSAGPAVDRADLEALVRLGRSDLDPAAAPPALRSAELVDDEGVLTDGGRAVFSALSAPLGHLRVESARGSTPLVLDVYLRSGWALVLATRSPASLPAAPKGDAIVAAATQLRLDYVDAAQVPVTVASWVGLAPAWSLGTSPEDLPERDILARVDDPRALPPAGADAHLRHAWEQPWFLWTLQAVHLTHGRVMVNAGRAGHFALTQGTGDLVGFRPVPSAAVWLDLVTLVAGESAG